jgi:hypothetical protein
MGWRFRRSIRILPGVDINLGKKGVSSVSLGRGGWVSTNVSKEGVRNTLHVPGSGLSYQTDRLTVPSDQPAEITAAAPAFLESPAPAGFRLNGWMVFGLLCGLLGLIIIAATYFRR